MTVLTPTPSWATKDDRKIYQKKSYKKRVQPDVPPYFFFSVTRQFLLQYTWSLMEKVDAEIFIIMSDWFGSFLLIVSFFHFSPYLNSLPFSTLHLKAVGNYEMGCMNWEKKTESLLNNDQIFSLSVSFNTNIWPRLREKTTERYAYWEYKGDHRKTSTSVIFVIYSQLIHPAG